MIAPEELALRCQRAPAGDTRPFELLVAHYRRRVFAIAYRLMGDAQEAEDQAQEIFLKIHRGIRSLEDPRLLTPWVVRIATNTCLDALSARERRPRTVPLSRPAPGGEAEEDQLADPRLATPEEEALREEVRRCLQRTLERLDPAERAVLVLRDVEDRPYQEIAATLSLGLSAVKMRIHRARLSFQRALNTVCPGVWRGAQTGGAQE